MEINKNHGSVERILIIIISLSFLILFDQTSKYFVKRNMEEHQHLSYINGFVQLDYIENEGGMLGFGINIPGQFKFWVLTVGVSVIISMLLIYLLIKRNENRVVDAALILIAGGGTGNLIDRLFNSGRVVDFVIIGFRYIHTAVFNAADFFILTGSVLLILSFLRRTE
jgi:signal peptidase II